ncbi:Essential recombination function protein [uncultured Caudovirales phage]|uniref:Essential recombination function protein n=1 Tax=uncultured Caudovirales phage TaxID=2100421 RepID=A0A6J5RX54_9CAUD|nr:Essential recombination function protein [uncultured Caudovirales phage]CAB4203317.1 Essential recombination function protein [uncultured Caudovirales phage]
MTTPNLSAALVKAQSLIKAVNKDAYNKHHQYKYASAEAMLTAAREALNDAGLAVSRTGWTIVDGDMPMLISTFRLDHESGEVRDFANLPWPILEGNGRPFDKALAGALTTQQAYFVRDLLQIPKEDENEVDKRNDKETVDKPTIGIAGAGAIRRKLKAKSLTLAAMVADMKKKNLEAPADLADWPKEWMRGAEAWIERQPSKESEANPTTDA